MNTSTATATAAVAQDVKEQVAQGVTMLDRITNLLIDRGPDILFAIVIFIYLMLMSKIGYILSTLLFLYIGQWMLGLKKSAVFFLFPPILTLVLYLLFTRVLSVILPMGTWIGINF